MELKNQPITGYILAGGKSSRMGTDKGLLLFNGKPMIQYVIDQMQTVFTKVVIVSNNPEYDKFGVEVIPDLIKDIGPAGGIYAALLHSETQLNFVVSCDMPFVTASAIEFIINNTKENQIVLVENNSKIEPLFGIYAKDCEQAWLHLIEQHKIKLQEMVLHFKFKAIPIENNDIFGKSFFKNINTKEDLNINNTMEIQVLAFGQIAEITGKSSWKMTDIKDTDHLVKRVEGEFPNLVQMKYSIALNKKIIQENTAINDRDTIALLPPFSGG
jgi:molybdopterin-guanine dinucleotide biosynthesis protein A